MYADVRPGPMDQRPSLDTGARLSQQGHLVGEENADPMLFFNIVCEPGSVSERRLTAGIRDCVD
ncbi:MAG: hypothetical protein HXY24_01920 [Rubrivivax sp.]|nr:hypothetical protein [Rubrivivax sp.]